MIAQTGKRITVLYPFRWLAISLIRIFGWSLRWVHINRVTLDPQHSRSLLIKQRKWYSWIPMVVGNIVFRFRYPRLYVLPTRQWLEWERQVQSVTLGDRHDIDQGQQLRTKILPGQTLASLLIQADHERLKGNHDAVTGPAASDIETELLEAVGWAAQALAELHSLSVAVPPRQKLLSGDANQPATATDSLGYHDVVEIDAEAKLSHGDAGVTNVMIDMEGQTARWFDFDLRHDFRTVAAERQADDLRAFLFTAAFCYRWSDLEVLLQRVQQEYRVGEVWNALNMRLNSSRFDYDFFHIAQLARSGGCHWDHVRKLRSII